MLSQYRHPRGFSLVSLSVEQAFKPAMTAFLRAFFAFAGDRTRRIHNSAMQHALLRPNQRRTVALRPLPGGDRELSGVRVPVRVRPSSILRLGRQQNMQPGFLVSRDSLVVPSVK
jgi:hypothetical protein